MGSDQVLMGKIRDNIKEIISFYVNQYWQPEVCHAKILIMLRNTL